MKIEGENNQLISSSSSKMKPPIPRKAVTTGSKEMGGHSGFQFSLSLNSDKVWNKLGFLWVEKMS